MGVFGKLMFWRKKKQEEKALELPKEQGQPASNYPTGNYPEFGIREEAPQQQPVMPTNPAIESSGREFQVLSSKLDVLNAKLDAINQRLSNLERMASEESEQKW